MNHLHVITRKEDLDPSRLADKVVVVLDVLFATSTIVAAFEHGAREVVPVPDPEAAVAAASGLPPDTVLLAGERNMERIPGFASYAPRSLVREGVEGKCVIYSTTNGTVALASAQSASAVYAAALRNGRAVADHVASRHPGQTILLLCAGSAGAFNIEDFYGAGYVVDCLCSASRDWRTTDAATAARLLFRAEAERAEQCLLGSNLGQRLAGLEMTDEVRFAARLGVYDGVAVLNQGRLTLEA